MAKEWSVFAGLCGKVLKRSDVGLKNKHQFEDLIKNLYGSEYLNGQNVCIEIREEKCYENGERGCLLCSTVRKSA